MNIVDAIIIAALLYYLADGYRRGCLNIIMELISFIISSLAGLYLSGFVGKNIVNWFNMPNTYGPSLGFIFVWVLLQGIFAVLIYLIDKHISNQMEESRTNKIIGIFTSELRGLIFISLILIFVMILPIGGDIKNIVNNSFIGNKIIKNGANVSVVLQKTFGGAVNDMVTFMTVKEPIRSSGQLDPSINSKILKPDELLNLGYTTTDVSEDEQSAAKMLELINKERMKRGLGELKSDNEMKKVALSHARDMFARGYFSHVSPDGVGPFDRILKLNIEYQVAGENLALAPTVDMAHVGLMNSPGHRANILEPRFGRIGIGVLNGGVYGRMFVQEYRD